MKEGIIKNNIIVHLKDIIDYNAREAEKVKNSLEKNPDECLLKIDHQINLTSIQLCKAIISNIESGEYDKEDFIQKLK